MLVSVWEMQPGSIEEGTQPPFGSIFLIFKKQEYSLEFLHYCIVNA